VYRTILWATDGSEGAAGALREALTLACLTRAHVIAVHCDQRLNSGAAEVHTQIAHKVEALQQDGVDIELVVRRSHREAADVVAAAAAELGADVIVCGTRGFGALAGVFLGSFTQRLLHIAPCPVIAVPERSFLSTENEPRATAVGA
jgi:nucleotide-binding universal stress UspA family protein